MKETEPRKPSPRVEARKRRDEAMHALGVAVYRAWIEGDRKAGPLDAELKAVDAACADVALQS